MKKERCLHCRDGVNLTPESEFERIVIDQEKGDYAGLVAYVNRVPGAEDYKVKIEFTLYKDAPGLMYPYNEYGHLYGKMTNLDFENFIEEIRKPYNPPDGEQGG